MNGMKSTPKVTFLLDENIDVRLGSSLTRSGYVAMFGEKGMKNGHLFSITKQHSAVLITLDNDFANIDLYPPSPTMGIIVFRIHPPKRDFLMNALQKFLSMNSPSSLLGKTHILMREGYEIVESR
jgi:predicted nuclease of predicted toxin-antitoxin system